ncbi:MAG: ferritin-like domain-containing protein [Ilumatobacteraceae bacterium]
MPVVKTGTTTAILPKQPIEADLVLLNAAQSAELAVRDVYNTALDAGGFSDVQQSVLELFRDHHTAYAQALNGLLGKSATNIRNESLYSSYANQVQSTTTSLSMLQALENILVATHTTIVGSLVGLDGTNLVASILMVEARHAAVFGSAPTMDVTAALNDVAGSLVTSSTVGG